MEKPSRFYHSEGNYNLGRTLYIGSHVNYCRISLWMTSVCLNVVISEFPNQIVQVIHYGQ